MRLALLKPLLLPSGLALFGACAAPPVHDRGLTSAPVMTFSESIVWQTDERLGPQIEPGRAFAGGGQSAGCTSCQ